MFHLSLLFPQALVSHETYYQDTHIVSNLENFPLRNNKNVSQKNSFQVCLYICFSVYCIVIDPLRLLRHLLDLIYIVSNSRHHPVPCRINAVVASAVLLLKFCLLISLKLLH